MKKKRYLWLFLTNMIIASVFLPAGIVQAQVYEFSSSYLEIDVPENTIVLTKDTPNTDEHWETAGILDPQEEKDNFETMGVQAIFYDLDTKSTAKLMKKDSSQSKNIHNLSLLSPDKLASFYESMTKTDDDTSLSIESYPHEETLFFRYELIAATGNTELIYGTILNGSMIWFDAYSESNIVSINETYMQSLVDETHITKLLDPSEVQSDQWDSLLAILGFLLFLTAILAIIVPVRKRKENRQKELRSQKAEKLTAFFKGEREKEALNIEDSLLFTNETIYSEPVIKQFTYYNLILKRTKLWIFTVIICLLLIFELYRSDDGSLKAGIGLLIIFVLVFLQNIQVEKLVKRTMNVYGNKDATMNFQFYEEYFTLKEGHSIIKYPYLQLTDVCEHKEYFYLYLSPHQAFYLRKENFNDLEAFKTFLFDKIRQA